MDLLIHPSETDRLITIKLPSPKGEEPDRVYLVDQTNFKVNEIIQYSDKFRSWFADDLLIKDGSFNMITPVDRLFIMLPFLIKSKGQFRTLHDIISSSGHSDALTLVLSPDTNWNLIGDTKDIDDELYIRYNQGKVLDWLENKRSKIIETLGKEIGLATSLATLRSYSSDLLADYLPTDLCDTFKMAAKNKPVLVDISADTPSDAKVSPAITVKIRPSTSGTKRKSDNKESNKSSNNAANKLTKWFSPISR